MNQHAVSFADAVRVLLIEDDPSVAQMYRVKLELDGYIVDVARDGDAGLEKARTTLPDMIFLDIRIGNTDGIAVLESMRAEPATARIPVVILSNVSDRTVIDRGIKLGALDYLIKSQTTPARLSQRLRDLLRADDRDAG